ncbi:MAG: purine-nucleoside phosphorylase [Candidatus Caenarcaniphilales bacterium]|nr:purine-nucleoside phosphorylase [Candidatus Caenarcaniphilales bacterium]
MSSTRSLSELIVQNTSELKVRLGLDRPLDLAIILGSGLRLSMEHKIIGRTPYTDILDLPITGVLGHARLLSHIEISKTGKRVLLFEGRFHLYEGLGAYAVQSLVDLAAMLGGQRLLVTNAAGGISPLLEVTNLMCIEKVIDFQNDGDLLASPRGLEDCLLKAPLVMNTPLSDSLISRVGLKSGTYIAVLGPNYETRSEIKLFQSLGADAVGMSTYLELRRGFELGLDIAGVSIITNSWYRASHPTHQEVLDNARLSEAKLNDLVLDLLDLPSS